ncbi:MAG: hypothetical protein K5922_01395 [Clostridiales bacterium]|nr:hypothetical protein [Clostridiales bacterium]
MIEIGKWNQEDRRRIINFAVPATTQNRCFYEKGGPFLLLKTHTCGIRKNSKNYNAGIFKTMQDHCIMSLSDRRRSGDGNQDCGEHPGVPETAGPDSGTAGGRKAERNTVSATENSCRKDWTES